MTDADLASELVAVRVRGVPLALLERVRQHQESLEREFPVIALASPDESEHVAARLVALVDEPADQFGTFSQDQAIIDEAVARGEATIDLEYDVPEAAGEAAIRQGALLDEADAFCRGGDLLTVATPDDCVELRRWFLGEFVAQVGDADPTSWDRWRR